MPNYREKHCKDIHVFSVKGTLVLLMSIMLSVLIFAGCSTTAIEESAEEEVVQNGTLCEVVALKGSIIIPDGYYAFGGNVPYTEQMCKDIGVEKERMDLGISLLGGQTLIVPADAPYEESAPHIYVKVKEKKYEDITLSELSDEEYKMLATVIVSGFGTDEYETVEGHGHRFFVFTADMGLGPVCRYATILNGHMVYVYADVTDKFESEGHRAVLEQIALSIQHGL